MTSEQFQELVEYQKSDQAVAARREALCSAAEIITQTSECERILDPILAVIITNGTPERAVDALKPLRAMQKVDMLKKFADGKSNDVSAVAGTLIEIQKFRNILAHSCLWQYGLDADNNLVKECHFELASTATTRPKFQLFSPREQQAEIWKVRAVRVCLEAMLRILTYEREPHIENVADLPYFCWVHLRSYTYHVYANDVRLRQALVGIFPHIFGENEGVGTRSAGTSTTFDDWIREMTERVEARFAVKNIQET